MNRKIMRCIDQLNAHCGDGTAQCCRHSRTSVCRDTKHPSRGRRRPRPQPRLSTGGGLVAGPLRSLRAARWGARLGRCGGGGVPSSYRERASAPNNRVLREGTIAGEALPPLRPACGRGHRPTSRRPSACGRGGARVTSVRYGGGRRRPILRPGFRGLLWARPSGCCMPTSRRPQFSGEKERGTARRLHICGGCCRRAPLALEAADSGRRLARPPTASRGSFSFEEPLSLPVRA